jgi:cysteine desulfuration protein SufE
VRKPGVAADLRKAERIVRTSPTFEGDSDAHIVRGLIAILFALYSGKNAQDILATDALALFDRIGLRENLTPQRSNGLRSMVERIRAEAKTALATVA